MQHNLWSAAILRRFKFWYPPKDVGRDTKNRTENQSGAGSPQSKVRPERLTGKVPAQPVKYIV